MDTKEKNASWLKGPMVSKKWDPFLSFLLAFTGAMISSTVYPQLDMPYWQFLLWVTPFAFLAVFLLKAAAMVWRRKKEQRDAE